jgi:hypothetical protein
MGKQWEMKRARQQGIRLAKCLILIDNREVLVECVGVAAFTVLNVIGL